MLPEWTPSQATGQRNGTDPAPPYKGPRIVCLGQGSTGTHALFVAAALLGQPAAHYMQEVLAQPALELVSTTLARGHDSGDRHTIDNDAIPNLIIRMADEDRTAASGDEAMVRDRPLTELAPIDTRTSPAHGTACSHA